MDPRHALLGRLVSRLKMRHLRLLQLIDEHGSLTRVAEHMATSQPAVTHALAELESLFGAPLFVRSPRGMTPTALGTIALQRARAMLQDLEHWTQDMAAASAGQAAHLHIGVIPFIPGRLLAEAIAQTCAQGQAITATLHEDTSNHLLARLRRHELDCVIGRSSAILDMTGLTHEILYEQQARLVANHRLAQRLSRQPLSWPDLAQLDWVLGQRDTPMREQIIDLFLRAGVAPPVARIESLSTKVIGAFLATQARAISLVPADIAQELMTHTDTVGVVSHRFDWTLPPITLFMRTDSPPRQADTQFLAALRQACRAQA